MTTAAELAAVLGAKPRYHRVEGSPFQPGETVKVVSVVDETVAPTYIGHTGLVVYLEYDCGSGQTFPNDPMIGVQFPDLPMEEFWQEEVQLCPTAPSA